MNWIGLDIGGANIKFSDGGGVAGSIEFSLWKQPDLLAPTLAEIGSKLRRHEMIAVTMTGELADCFINKRAGVNFIVGAVEQAFPRRLIRFYQSDGQLVDATAARDRYGRTAAANWHALAQLAGNYLPTGDGVLVDIGSTTTDIVPIRDGQPASSLRSDVQRIVQGQLLYTGVVRSPLSCVATTVPYRGRRVVPAHEVFATMLDVYIVLRKIAEDSGRLDTADRRPWTYECAVRRLARMVCCDEFEFDVDDAGALAADVEGQQLDLVVSALMQVIDKEKTHHPWLVLSGSGEFLGVEVARRLGMSAQSVRLSERIGTRQSHGAAAYAVARIASQSVDPAVR